MVFTLGDMRRWLQNIFQCWQEHANLGGFCFTFGACPAFLLDDFAVAIQLTASCGRSRSVPMCCSGQYDQRAEPPNCA